MRKLLVDEWMSLDGVIQAPGAPDEDTRGGFRHGGWHLRYFDAVSQEWVLDNLTEAGAFVFGRRTYEAFAAYWPNPATEQELVIAEPLNSKPKYVASMSLSEPLGWKNSNLLDGDIAQALNALKSEDGGDLHVIGSARLVHSLIQRELIDEFRLMIDPVILGGGLRLFGDDGALRSLQLVQSEVTTTGAILATYAASRA